MTNPKVTLTRDQLWRAADGGIVQVATPLGMIRIEVENPPWVSMWRLDPTPPHMIDAHRRIIGDTHEIEVWTNGEYEVIVGVFDSETKHLSVKRMDRAPIRNWRHLQQIKNEICGLEWEAVELFPAESRLADNANQYHLWAMADKFPIGFPEGMVTDDTQTVAFNEADHSGRQEPWQPGLTTGRNDQTCSVPDTDLTRRYLRGQT